MADDIGKAVAGLQKMLQDDELRESLQSIVGQVVGDVEQAEEDNDGSGLSDMLGSMDLGALINSAAAPDDHRIALLKALKPYLNVRRQERIGNAISIMKFVNLSSTLGLMDMLKGDVN